MKPSLELKSFIDKSCHKYCNQLGLSEPPLIIYDVDELKQAGYNDKSRKQIQTHDGAHSWVKGNIDNLDQDLVLMLVENTDFLWQITDFLVHELVHIRFPNLEHGDEFQSTVNDIVMGKRY